MVSRTTMPKLEAKDPPVFRIDLDLPPQSRYNEVIQHFRDELQEYNTLFEDVTYFLPCSQSFRFLSRFVLRRVYDSQENEEIRGIAEASGLDTHLVVALNVFLDILCACTSGGVVMDQDCQGEDIPSEKRTMYHFRTLDWFMEEMRDLVYEAHYIRDGKTIAQAITYAAYTGVLTGVRRGLSISLNHRAAYNTSSYWQSMEHVMHRILVLLGRRPSIATVLRGLLLSEHDPLTLDELQEKFPSIPTTACYLFFSDGKDMLYLEKDHVDAKARLTKEIDVNGGSYVLGTNHDMDMESWTEEQFKEWERAKLWFAPDGLKGIVDESMDRKTCLATKLDRRYPQVVQTSNDDIINVDSKSALSVENSTPNIKTESITSRLLRSQKVNMQNLCKWIQDFPTRNEITHFSCIMDASEGEIVWREWYSSCHLSLGNPEAMNSEILEETIWSRT